MTTHNACATHKRTLTHNYCNAVHISRKLFVGSFPGQMHALSYAGDVPVLRAPAFIVMMAFSFTSKNHQRKATTSTSSRSSAMPCAFSVWLPGNIDHCARSCIVSSNYRYCFSQVVAFPIIIIALGAHQKIYHSISPTARAIGGRSTDVRKRML